MTDPGLDVTPMIAQPVGHWVLQYDLYTCAIGADHLPGGARADRPDKPAAEIAAALLADRDRIERGIRSTLGAVLSTSRVLLAQLIAVVHDTQAARTEPHQRTP